MDSGVLKVLHVHESDGALRVTIPSGRNGVGKYNQPYVVYTGVGQEQAVLFVYGDVHACSVLEEAVQKTQYGRQVSWGAPTASGYLFQGRIANVHLKDGVSPEYLRDLLDGIRTHLGLR